MLFNSGLPASIKQINYVAGGCINKCYKIDTTKTAYFLKINDTENYPNMFGIEAKSLNKLSATNCIKIPEVITQFNAANKQFLLLEWIESVKPEKNFWEKFAENLAKLHQQTTSQFGLDFDNYIGSLKQSNSCTASWLAFYINERIEPQVKLAHNQNKITKSDIRQFERFYKALPNIFPNEKPALIHGDLWAGNFLCDQNQNAVLVDPAIYYANREMEIAFSQLFGGFHPAFYQTYQEIYPLENGFQQRIAVYNLYSLLVHLNLFGSSYYEQVISVVKRF